MKALKMTTKEVKQGHVPCDCGEFTYVFAQHVLQRLPRDYSGELCGRCDLWVCRLDKLQEDYYV
jgi:hypothetical protein